MILKHY